MATVRNHTSSLAHYVKWLEDTGRLTREERETVEKLINQFIEDECQINQQGC